VCMSFILPRIRSRVKYVTLLCYELEQEAAEGDIIPWLIRKSGVICTFLLENNR
jgi:hypothetical protein